MGDTSNLEAALLLARWRKELGEAVEAQKEIGSKIYGLKKMIEGMEIVHPDLKPFLTNEEKVGDEATAATKSVADHVREILRENPGRWFASGEMVKAVRSRDMTAEPPAVRLALRRTEGNLSEKRGDGKGQIFRLKQEPDSDSLPTAAQVLTGEV